MKHKKLFITFTVVFSVLLALVIFIMIWFWGDRYNNFDDFRSEVVIPGLKDGACPQGITTYKANYTETVTDADGKETTKTKSQNYFFITSYFKSQASRIYVVGEETGEVGYVTLKNIDGSDHTGHVGGVATNGTTLWVSSGRTVYVAKKATTTSSDNIATDIIKLAKENGEVKFTASFKANCNASFLYYYQSSATTTANSTSNKLYVGEFYRSGKYETDELHHLTTPKGETNRAFAYEYSIASSTGSDYPFGLSTADGVDKDGNKVPKIQKIFSLPNEVQGFARTNKGLVLSVSYGLKNSHIYYYDYDWSTVSNNNREKYVDIGKGTDKNKQYSQGFYYDGATKTTSSAPYYDDGVYVYYIDDDTMLNDYSIPSMSEGLCTIDDRVYVLFESGAKKYNTFVRQVLTNVYSFIPRSKH